MDWSLRKHRSSITSSSNGACSERRGRQGGGGGREEEGGREEGRGEAGRCCAGLTFVSAGIGNLFGRTPAPCEGLSSRTGQGSVGGGVSVREGEGEGKY